MSDEMDVEVPSESRDSEEPEPEEAEPKESQPATTCSEAPAVEDDGDSCPICLDLWTNCGDHRICSLRCGHLFGHKCILRWFSMHPTKICPTCKKKARKSDIRFIFAARLTAVEYTEMERLKQELETAIMQKNAALESVSKYISRERILLETLEDLKTKVRSSMYNTREMAVASRSKRLRLYMDKNLVVCDQSNCTDCRHFDISVPHDTLMFTAPSRGSLFGDFGVRTLSLSCYKTVNFLPLHKDPIKDMALHSDGRKVLTVSIDKKFKVTDTQSVQTPFTVNLDSAPWACCWTSRECELIVGTQKGEVKLYDIRNVSEPIATQLSVPGDFSPVISVSEAPEHNLLLIAKLNCVWAFERNPDGTFKTHLLPLQGPFLSIKYDQDTRQALVSSRPNKHMPYARHTVFYLGKGSDPEMVDCNVVHTFKGGNTVKLLAKTSCFVPDNVVAGYNENRKSILLYSVNTGEEIAACPTHDNLVLDVKGFQTTNGKFLAYLNESKLTFFKMNEQ